MNNQYPVSKEFLGQKFLQTKKYLMGEAIWDFYYDNDPKDLLTETSISEIDELPVDYLFRPYEEMNEIEKTALQYAKGKVLDIGAGAGSHSLYLQNEKKLDTTALDISEKSVEICKARGVKKAICQDILDFENEKFDTLLLLMNGTGIFQSLYKIDEYFDKLKKILNKNGQILIDGTDIIYMFDRDEDGGVYIPAGRYYGEVDYILHYKGDMEVMSWLYLDFETLKKVAENNGFHIEKILQEEHSYLAKLTLKE